MNARKKTARAGGKKPREAEPEPTFEEALAALEDIVTRLEEGEVSLQESLDAYQAGKELVRQCLTRLEHAEALIETLGAVGEELRPTSLDDEPGPETEGDEDEQADLPF